MEKEVTYWEVTYMNTESNERWTVVKCPIEMDEYEIMSRMMDDSEVAKVYSAVEITMTDYGRDFTTEAE
jgi:hypothetical protein